MAINSITFGGVNSADFGIYISGEGVFDAPKRDVEMISIPGRDGALALDKGRFENIEVTYPAFNFEPGDYETFAQNLSDFRNAICSQRGYQRLTDTFHPDEYRMATYIGGLEIKPIKYNTASEFSIVFDCKPQRWLTSGETAVTVASGDTLTNPTLFESSPLLEVEGYGTIGFNGYEIELENAQLGEVTLALAKNPSWSSSAFDIALSQAEALETGDEITFGGVSFSGTYGIINKSSGGNYGRYNSVSVTSCTGVDGCSATATRGESPTRINLAVTFPSLAFENGTSRTYTVVTTISVVDYDTSSCTVTVTNTVSYNGNNKITLGQTSAVSVANYTLSGRKTSVYGETTAYSTQSLLGHPTYIDCDLGEAYKYEGTSLISLNRYIDLGSDLPKLASGANEVTFDNTVTELTVTPRWWKI